MPIYKRGESYLVCVGSGPGRYRQSFKDEGEAKQAHADALKRVKEGKNAAVKEKPAGKTLKDAYDLIWKLKWSTDKSKDTHKGNGMMIVNHFGPQTPLTDITTDLATEAAFEFQEELGNTGSTVNRKMSALRTMLKKAQEYGWIDKVPKLPFFKEGKHRIRWMDDKEEAKALELCKELDLLDLHDYIIVAIDSGFRRAELLAFESRDYFNGLLHLHAGETKNDEARAIPATDRVADILQRRHNQRRPFEGLTINSLRYQWRQLRKAMGLENDPQFVVHMLRHTCASRLVQKDVHLGVVQIWMGHKDSETTGNYSHFAPNSLMGAMQKLQNSASNSAPASGSVESHA